LRHFCTAMLALLVACDKLEGQDPAVRWTVGRLHDDAREAETARDPTFACTAVRDAAIQLKDVSAARGDLAAATATCRKAVQAFAEARLAAAAKAKGPAVDDCVDSDRALALLAVFGGDPAPLEKRRKGLCP
jgi:hypothetical protein